MVKVEKLTDILRKHPEFKQGWHASEEALPNGTRVVTGLENPKFGIVERVVVCRDDGQPMYDKYQIAEGPVLSDGTRKASAVIVPFFREEGTLYLGLIKNLRELAINPETGLQGYVSTEFPRGFANLEDATDEETAKRELGEETGKVAKTINKIGRVNPNTAFYATSLWVYAVEVDPIIKSGFKPDQTEIILKCEFVPYADLRQMVAQQEISCGLSLSALMLFDSYLSSAGPEEKSRRRQK